LTARWSVVSFVRNKRRRGKWRKPIVETDIGGCGSMVFMQLLRSCDARVRGRVRIFSARRIGDLFVFTTLVIPC
jgi:hypothetical protein